MHYKKQPRNKNISVRVTAAEKREFERLAAKNHTNPSNWAYHILSKHKDSYGKVEDKVKLVEGIELTIEGIKFAHDELSKLQIEETFTEKQATYELLRTKLFFEVQKFKKLKAEILKQ